MWPHSHKREPNMCCATWTIRMWWYNMVSSCHTYSGPCGHTQVWSLPLYICSPCGHHIFVSIFITVVAHVVVQLSLPVAALVVFQDAHANINTYCSPCGQLIVTGDSWVATRAAIGLDSRMRLLDATWAVIGLDSYRRLLYGHMGHK